jgi:hypothetical protein
MGKRTLLIAMASRKPTVFTKAMNRSAVTVKLQELRTMVSSRKVVTTLSSKEVVGKREG